MVLLVEALLPVAFLPCPQPVPRLRVVAGEELAFSRIQALCFSWDPSWVHAGKQLPDPHQCGG